MSVINQTTLLDMAVKAIRDVSEAARVVAIEPDTLLVEDLSLDSLDMVAIFMRLQEDHGVELNIDDVVNFRKVSDLMDELNRRLHAKSAGTLIVSGPAE